MYFNILGYLPYGIMLYPICMCECVSKCRSFFFRNNFPLVEAHLPSNVFYHLLPQTNPEQNLEECESTNNTNVCRVEFDYFRIFLFTVLKCLFYFKGLSHLKSKASSKEITTFLWKLSLNHKTEHSRLYIIIVI